MADEHKRIAPAEKLPKPGDDFESMSDEELEAGQKALANARTALGAVQDEIKLVQNRRTNEAQAEAKLAGLDETGLNVLIEAATAKLAVSAEVPG